MFASASAVKGQIEGPITLSAYLFHRGQPFLSDPALFAAVAFHVSQMICWQIDRLKSVGLPVLLFVDEPALSLEVPCANSVPEEMRLNALAVTLETRGRAEPTPDFIAAQHVRSNVCTALSPISFRSMLTRDLTYFLPIGVRLTSCNREELLHMELCPRDPG